MYSRVLTVQDISCVGQCSMTVALPILSCCGVETCVLPSAVLPTNSGLLGGFIQRDLTEDFMPICSHWEKNGIKFDGIYSGYLGSEKQIQLLSEIISRVKKPDGKLIVDPVMADDGKLYSGFRKDYIDAVSVLCRKADLILPNLTEACLMTGIPWKQNFSKEETENILCNLKIKFDSRIILTGVSFCPNEIGVAILDGTQIRYYFHKRILGSYHGTGDIFASVLVGSWMQGRELYDAAVKAADFTADCILETQKNPAHDYGVKFEPLLSRLMK